MFGAKIDIASSKKPSGTQVVELEAKANRDIAEPLRGVGPPLDLRIHNTSYMGAGSEDGKTVRSDYLFNALVRYVQDGAAGLAVDGIWIVPLKAAHGAGEADLVGPEKDLRQPQE